MYGQFDGGTELARRRQGNGGDDADGRECGPHPYACLKWSMKMAEELYTPELAKMAAKIATPNTPPTSRMELFVPDAIPISSGGTDPTTALATVGKHRDIPTPATPSARASCV